MPFPAISLASPFLVISLAHRHQPPHHFLFLLDTSLHFMQSPPSYLSSPRSRYYSPIVPYPQDSNIGSLHIRSSSTALRHHGNCMVPPSIHCFHHRTLCLALPSIIISRSRHCVNITAIAQPHRVHHPSLCPSIDPITPATALPSSTHHHRVIHCVPWSLILVFRSLIHRVHLCQSITISSRHPCHWQ